MFLIANKLLVAYSMHAIFMYKNTIIDMWKFSSIVAMSYDYLITSLKWGCILSWSSDSKHWATLSFRNTKVLHQSVTPNNRFNT